MTPRAPAHGGWSLLEVLLVLVLTSVLAVVVARLLTLNSSMPGAGLAAVQGAERIAPVLERLGREAQQALPWSARVASAGPGQAQYLEWVPVLAVARYRAQPAQTRTPPGDMLDFADPLDDRFEVLGPFAPPPGATDIVIHNTGPGGGAVYAGSNRRTFLGVTAGTAYFVPAGLWPAPSPRGEFAVVSGPVSWVCQPAPAGGTLSRITGYPMQATQPTGAVGTWGRTEVVLRGVSACGFNVGAGPRAAPRLTVELVLEDGDAATPMIRSWVLNSEDAP